MRAWLARLGAFDPSRAEDWAVWGLRVSLLGAVAWYWQADAALTYTSGPVLATAVLGGVLLGAAASSLPCSSPRHLRAGEAAWGFIVLAYFLGHYLDLYAHFAHYDKAMHLVGGALAGAIAWAVTRGTTWILPAGAATPGRVAVVVLATALIGGVLVEFAEYGADKVFGTAEQAHPNQSGLDDTMTDLLFDAAGGLAAAAAAAAVVRRRGAQAGAGTAARRGPTMPPTG